MSSEFENPEIRGAGRGRTVFAAAAALAVLILGAGFLLSLNPRAIEPTNKRAKDAPSPAAEIGAGAYGAVVWPERPKNAQQDIDRSDRQPAPKAEIAGDAAVKRENAGLVGPEIAVAPQPARTDSQVEASGPDAPRLKPRLASAAVPPAPAPAPSTAVLSLATRWLAGEDDRPAPVFFQSDLVADRAPPPPLAVAYAKDIAGDPREIRVSLSKGETFVDVLRRAGVRADDRNQAAYAFGKLYNLRQLRPGQSFDLTLAEPNKTLFELMSLDDTPALHLVALDFNGDPEKRVRLRRTPGGGFVTDERAAPLTTRIAAVSGRIDGSLYLSAKRQGAPDEVIAGLAQMFAYDVDFQREIFGGDEFEAIFEVRYDETGKLVAGGDVLYGRLKWRGRQKEKGYYRFAQEPGGRADYFDAKGESARRLLMKTPIDGARLSSGFGTRRHPILGYAKEHKGVDFAAATGTPIMAAGDGVVERAGPYGSFGNYVSIRHTQGYKTAYAHMNSIKKGVRAGARVRQGEVIGTVGSTGRSTGPHLHYEVHYKNTAVNPQSLKIATGYELGGKDLARFRAERDRIDALRAGAPAAEPNLVAENAKNAAL